jgi:DNA-binding transcriptional ArsR family regulator
MLNLQDPLTSIFHALADPTRRAIVERLSAGPATIGQLAEPMAMSLAAVMQHVQLLERARLITTQKQGRVRMCQIEAATLERLEDWLNRRRRQWEGLFDRLAQVLDEEATPPKAPNRRET